MASCVTSVGNDNEAHVVVERLAEAGIHAWPSGLVGRGSAKRDIYVEDADLDRARSVLGVAEDISEAELIRAEEEDAARRGIGPNAES